MFITARFVDITGSPILGLTPTLEIWEVESTNKVVDNLTMDEIDGGWYKYDFAGDYQQDYVVSCDGGVILDLDVRFQEGTVDMSGAFMEQIESGRWRIQNNQMIFYDKDNVTPIITFNLTDGDGNPTSDKVAERIPI